MQDRFRLRFWNGKPSKKMVYCDDENYQHISFRGYNYLSDDQIDVCGWDDTEILMQCTGLKDKNGKLIYEGDIISYGNEYFKKPMLSKVIWDEQIACFTNLICLNSCEVVGNIYENPELLEK
jgi:uncharacterized phage protein (TIGR01671 family)